MIHDFGNAQELLREAGRSGIGEAVHGLAEAVQHAHGFAAGGELSLERADDEETLATAGAGGASLEGADIGRNVEDAIRGHDGAGREGELHAAIEFPAGDFHRERREVAEAHVFLALIAGGRIGLHPHDDDDGVGRLWERNAGAVGGANADGPAGVGDAVGAVKMLPTPGDELVQQVTDASIKRLAGGPG